MNDLNSFLLIISKGKQDFSKKNTSSGTVNTGTTITVVTSDSADIHFSFDLDGNFQSASVS